MSQTLSVEQRVAVARDFVSVVFNGHHPERAVEYFTPDVVWHGGSLGTVSGVENMTGLLTGFLGALPDLRAEEQGVIASDDLVVMRLVVTATHKGDLLGIPATGRSGTARTLPTAASRRSSTRSRSGPSTRDSSSTRRRPRPSSSWCPART